MEYSIAIDRKKGLILVSAHGLACMEHFQSYVTDLLKPPCSEVNYGVLTDLRNVDMRALCGDDVRNIAQLVGQRRDDMPAIKHAVVVSGPLSFGFVRMYQSLSEDVDPQDMRVFYDIDEAHRWVCPEGEGKGVPVADQ